MPNKTRGRAGLRRQGPCLQEHRTKFVYYFPRGHNLILQPQLQAVSDLVNKVIRIALLVTDADIII
jgi:hypothetical protein